MPSAILNEAPGARGDAVPAAALDGPWEGSGGLLVIAIDGAHDEAHASVATAASGRVIKWEGASLT